MKELGGDTDRKWVVFHGMKDMMKIHAVLCKVQKMSIYIYFLIVTGCIGY